MKTVISYFLMLGLFMVSSSAFSEPASPSLPEMSVQYETATPGKFLQEWIHDTAQMKNTLILLDLDDTVMTTPPGTWLGSSEMFYQLRHQLRERYPHLTNKQAVDKMNPLFFAAYTHTPLILTDHRLPEVIDRLKQEGAKVIGITARTPAVIPVTLKQLKQLGVEFSSLLNAEPVDMHGSYSIEIKNGVVFAGQGYTKGEVLVQLLKAERLGLPSKVVLVDDREEHLKSAGEALAAWNKSVHFIPVLCTYPQGRHERYQDNVAKSELLQFIYKYREEAEVKQLIKHNLYTASFINEVCEKWVADHNEACKALLSMQNGKL